MSLHFWSYLLLASLVTLMVWDDMNMSLLTNSTMTVRLVFHLEVPETEVFSRNGTLASQLCRCFSCSFIISALSILQVTENIHSTVIQYPRLLIFWRLRCPPEKRNALLLRFNPSFHNSLLSSPSLHPLNASSLLHHCLQRARIDFASLALIPSLCVAAHFLDSLVR